MIMHNIHATVAYSLFVETLMILLCTLVHNFAFVYVILDTVGKLHFHPSFIEVYVVQIFYCFSNIASL